MTAVEPTIAELIRSVFHKEWVCVVVDSGFHNGARCTPEDPHGGTWQCQWQYRAVMTEERFAHFISRLSTTRPSESTETVITATGPLRVHSRYMCKGMWCAIHNPSDHPLKSRPLNWRGHVMERICEHGVGHPDPDDLAWRESQGIPSYPVHGCDGCCDRTEVGNQE